MSPFLVATARGVLEVEDLLMGRVGGPADDERRVVGSNGDLLGASRAALEAGKARVLVPGEGLRVVSEQGNSCE
jgi:hypothetical protein